MAEGSEARKPRDDEGGEISGSGWAAGERSE